MRNIYADQVIAKILRRKILADLFILFLLLCFCPLIFSQENNPSFGVILNGAYISPDKTPFWLRSNQYESIPADYFSLSLIGTVHRDYDNSHEKLIDWGAAFEGRLNIGNKSTFNIIEGSAKVKLGIFELKAGRSKDIMGLCDTSLTSGAFAVSGNVPGIPQIKAGIPEFYSLPVMGRLFAFKGSYTHGWIGKINVKLLDDTIDELQTFFHQKSLYGRFGKPEWKWKLYGGFNHQAFWGSEDIYYGTDYTLSPIQAYFYVITGKPYGTSAFSASKIGNHLGSIDIGFEYKFTKVLLFAYRQNIYDIGALYYLANIRDGLNGISLVNTGHNNAKIFNWKKVLVELFYTKNQAGELWSPVTPSGDENYYNNDQYPCGYSYRGLGIGNPFICTSAYTREGLPADPDDYFLNNRVIVIHIGFEGSVEKSEIILKASYSINYGTFGTSEVGHTVGGKRTLPKYGIFPETRQFSAYLEGNRQLKNGLNVGLRFAFDKGELYYNSFGLLIGLSRTF